ncbi:nicotinate-nucleotide adenylyltransferase [Paenibacillus sp. J5C_2022]|uniref:nicotinate-nucleotide adenylyltransferase n=1 Tax=Paenibacillus sp. J5C2022 TaxID=2977129 RepID=UPI0021D2959E|nr:nicotinate-nucleotide adenylyltransferase [Paenibacillus sp. J5C2022]MCU6709546.1 nicotinate-nucleotide adenylyltransferase [Paenibacillus sp. J5C2022]
MRHIGIMGGAFDPIHTGHLLAAEAARDGAGLDEVWFIPSAVSPLKANEPGMSGEQRYEMVCEAIKGNEAFRALDLELHRGGVSYSIDTVTELQSRYPDCSFAYIIGSDRIHDLHRWHRIGELAERIAFIGLERPSDALRTEALPNWLKERLTMVDMPAIGISSTAIRQRLAEGRSVRYAVPEPVYQYIRRHKLYEARRND